MTFAFLPHRSSSDDDALDQQLNDWVTRSASTPEPASDHAADALEFLRWADSTRRSDPAATGPAAGTWNRVLRNSAQALPKRSRGMSTAVLSSQPHGYGKSSAAAMGESVRHYSRLVATIAIVFAIAASGWFAMSQMPGGGGDGRFAAFQGTPEVAQSQTCDVDPLTVDEVMEIVRNPYRYLYERASPENQREHMYAFMAELELAEGTMMPSYWEANSVNRSTPAEEEFDQASADVNRFIDCADGATYGQYWALVHPIWVQMTVLSAHPVFADEQSVRSHVEEVIHEPVDVGDNGLEAFYDVYGNVAITANPDVEMADRLLWSTPDEEPIIAMGVRVTDVNGEVIMETDSTGFPHEIRQGSVTSRPVVVVQRSSLTGEWYVLPWLGQYT